MNFNSHQEIIDYAIEKIPQVGPLFNHQKELSIKKDPEVGDIFINYGKIYSNYTYDSFVEIVKITDKSIMYKPLKYLCLGEYHCQSDWGSSKKLFYYQRGKYTKDSKTQRMKRKKISALALPDSFLYIDRYLN